MLDKEDIRAVTEVSDGQQAVGMVKKWAHGGWAYPERKLHCSCGASGTKTDGGRLVRAKYNSFTKFR